MYCTHINTLTGWKKIIYISIEFSRISKKYKNENNVKLALVASPCEPTAKRWWKDLWRVGIYDSICTIRKKKFSFENILRVLASCERKWKSTCSKLIKNWNKYTGAFRTQKGVVLGGKWENKITGLVVGVKRGWWKKNIYIKLK